MLRMLIVVLLAAFLAPPAAAFAQDRAAAEPGADEPAADHPEATPYDPASDANAAVDAALVRADERGTRVLLVMGANWCHDSRALAGWLESDRFAALLAESYEVVFVNVGMPQTGDGFNLGIARRFGIDDLPGTPNLLVIAPDGTLLNADTATSWRNSASRTGNEIFAELAGLAAQK